MNKEFIPYQESLELKELGFDTFCFGEYRQWDGSSPYLQLYQHLDGCSTDPADYEYTTECLAPTFSQAFRWFREKHDLDYSLLPESSSGYRLLTRTFNIVIYKYYMNMNVQAEIVRIDGKIAIYNKREEAELACLRKLIELVKEKK